MLAEGGYDWLRGGRGAELSSSCPSAGGSGCGGVRGRHEVQVGRHGAGCGAAGELEVMWGTGGESMGRAWAGALRLCVGGGMLGPEVGVWAGGAAGRAGLAGCGRCCGVGLLRGAAGAGRVLWGRPEPRATNGAGVWT